MKQKRSQAQAMHETREAENHRLIGGEPCLDFANTVNGHTRSSRHEYLHDFRDLVLWSQHATLVTPKQAKVLLKNATAQPSAAAHVYRTAIALREVIFRVFAALAIGGEPDQGDLNQLSAAWQEAQRHACVAPFQTGFSITWDDDPTFKRIPRSMCISAINLLTSEKIKQIRECAGEHCDWLFIDSSRNHLRRWCSMDECGNRAKMRRRQFRKKHIEPT